MTVRTTTARSQINTSKRGFSASRNRGSYILLNPTPSRSAPAKIWEPRHGAPFTVRFCHAAASSVLAGHSLRPLGCLQVSKRPQQCPGDVLGLSLTEVC